MSIDATGTYHIPSSSWHPAQGRPGDRFKIGVAVVVQSAIESWDLQHPHLAFPVPPPPRVDSYLMSIDAPETYLIPACS